MAHHSEQIKGIVRDAYARAVQESAGGCCGGARREARKGRLVGMAGYSPEQLDRLPEDAVANAFGCGNPLAFAAVRPGDVVLDIGSGAGIDCLIAAEKVLPGGRVIGIDMTPEMIQRATENARRAGADHVTFRLGDAEAMPVATASVDWIISNCVINLSPDKARVFGEMQRVLKPGGRFIISDIVLGSELPEALRKDLSALVGCLAGAMLETAYLQGLERAGFTEVAVTERLIYTRSQLEQFAGAALWKRIAGESGLSAEEFGARLNNQVWSAKITGRKEAMAAPRGIEGETGGSLPAGNESQGPGVFCDSTEPPSSV